MTLDIRTALLVAFASGLIVGPVSLASAAKDYCIHGVKPCCPGLDVTYVGQDFKIPGAGKCTSWAGFCSSGCSQDNVQTGSACTASDGSHVSFAITTAYFASNRQWDFVRLDLPSETGNGNVNDLFSGIGGTFEYDASGAACMGAVVP